MGLLYDTITVNSGVAVDGNQTIIVPDRTTSTTGFFTRGWRSGDVCIGPDGEVWACWFENELEGVAQRGHGVFVVRWDPGSSDWVLVTGPTTDGAVSDCDYTFSSAAGGFAPYTGGLLEYMGTGFAPEPRICCDGTNVFVSWVTGQCNNNPGTAPFLRAVGVAMWDGSSWTILPALIHATQQINSLNRGGVLWAYIAASPGDTGAVYVAYNERQGDNSGGTVWSRSYCSRWNGSSWDDVGGSEFATGFQVPYFTPGNPLFVDANGDPHIASTDTGWSTNPFSIFDELRVYSYVSGAWRTSDLDPATLGIGASFQSGGSYQLGYGPNFSPGFDLDTSEEHVHVCINIYRYDVADWCYLVLDFDPVAGVWALPEGINPPFFQSGALFVGTPIAAYDGDNLHWAVIDGGGSSDADLLRYDINCRGWDVVEISNASDPPQPLRSSVEHPHVILDGDTFHFYNAVYVPAATGNYERYLWDLDIVRDGAECPPAGGVFRTAHRVTDSAGPGDYPVLGNSSLQKVFTQLPSWKGN